MKQFIQIAMFAAMLFVVATPSYSQVPRQISYQGSAADGSGNALVGTHSITVQIYSPGNVSLYSETFSSVNFTKGVFSIILGASAPIPSSVAFDAQYTLGVSIDGGTEVAPRTPLTSVPYALIADGLSSNAAVVTSINSQSGALTLQGGGGTTITNTGSSFTISSSGGGGTGVQGVQNTDGTLAITNPNGPTATISIASGGVKSANIAANAITNTHIADGTISTTKLSSGTATNGQILTWNGSSWAPASGGGGGGFTLPYSNSVSNSNPLFDLTNTGSSSAIRAFSSQSSVTAIVGVANNNNGLGVLGRIGSGAGYTSGSGVCGSSDSSYGVTGNTNAGIGVQGYSAGTGIAVHGKVGSGATSAQAGVFELGYSTNTGNALESTTAGTGEAGDFSISNSSSSANGVHISNAGGGDGLYVEANYAAIHGYSHTVSSTKQKGNPQISGVWNGVFGETDNGSGYGIKGLNNSSSGNGIAVYGYTANGDGVYGQSDTNTGVYGYSISGSGVFGNHSSSSGSKAGVEGISSSTTGGAAADGTTGAVGVLGELTPTSGGAYSSAIRGINLSTTGNGVGVAGYVNGGGWGVYGYSATGTGGRFFTGSASATVYAVYSDGHAYKSDGNASWSIASDERLKQNIRPFTDGLGVISQINPIWFQYNGQAGTRAGEDHVGVLAQNMQAAAPYTVAPMKAYAAQSDTTGTDILSYNPSALTYVQINAIKELSNKLNGLQQQMQQMQTTIETLTQTLTANGIPVPVKVVTTH